MGLGICIRDKFPDAAWCCGSGTTHGETVLLHYLKNVKNRKEREEGHKCIDSHPGWSREASEGGACGLQLGCLSCFPRPSELRPLVSAPSLPITSASLAGLKPLGNASFCLSFSLQMPVLSLEMSCQIRSQISQEYPSKCR